MNPIRVIALVEKEIWVADPKECQLCKAGSLRYRPKANWKELTGKKELRDLSSKPLAYSSGIFV